MKKEKYVVSLDTLDGFSKAEKIQARLYEKYDNVEVITRLDNTVVIIGY